MSLSVSPDTLPKNPTPAAEERRQENGRPAVRWFVLIGAVLVIAGLATWASLTYRRPVAPYGGQAVFLFPLLILLVDVVARLSAFRSVRRAAQGSDQTRTTIGGRMLALPQVTLPLYLACAVLLGVQTAVLAALLIEGILQLAMLAWRVRSMRGALYRVAANGLVVLAGGGCYQVLVRVASLGAYQASFPVRLGVAAIGALVMLALWPLAVLPLQEGNLHGVSLRPWLRSFRTSEARFQLLLLSIGPLLPLADGLDDLEAELAWVLFLVPLFAIYYLALVSLRFQRQTEELRASLQALRLARRRQAELQDYAALVTRAQEDERRRLARELHDDTAQALIALSRGLEALSDARSAGRALSDEARWVEDLCELADRSLESVRRACRDLRPSVLDDLGLSAALDWLVEGTTQRGLPCTLRVEGGRLELPGEAELVLFRIAQEALANAWRHAQASQVEMLLSYESALVRLRVQDNGCGFDLAQVELRHTGSGLGLLGMRERASLIGADLHITSSGRGTVVEVRLALAAHA
jgi:signal transduction histidine kinase